VQKAIDKDGSRETAAAARAPAVPSDLRAPAAPASLDASSSMGTEEMSMLNMSMDQLKAQSARDSVCLCVSE
jgi:hypothetical protein